MKSSRLIQLDLIDELIDMTKLQKPLSTTDYFARTFALFERLKKTGLSIPDEFQGLFLQVLILPPPGMSRTSWFHSISSELERSNLLKPRDVQRMINSYLVSIKENDDEQLNSQSIMKLAPRNKALNKNNYMNQFSDSMSKMFIKTSEDNSSKSQVKALCMPNEKEIKQAQLNIKLGNRQPSEALQKLHGMECHYCKTQGLHYIGHWVSTCPIIRDILKLEKAPPPMAGNELVIRAVTGNRTASMVDTSSQVHVSGVIDFFTSKYPLDPVLPLNLASPSFRIYATHRGTIRLPYSNLEVNNVLYCKEVEGTLLSLGQFIDEGYSTKFVGNDIHITSKDGCLFCIANLINCSWILSAELNITKQPTIRVLNSKDAYEWHCWLGHASDKIVKQFLKLYVPTFDQKSWLPFFCEHCSISKSTRRQLQANDEAPWTNPRDLMVSDTRDQVPKVLTDTFHLIKSVFKDSVKFLRSDNAKEYSGQNFRISLTTLGTQQLFTSPYTPEQNGEAERLNHTLGDSARTMLRASGLPTSFWSYAYKCAAYINNRIPNSQTGNKTPMELWCGRKPQPFRIYPFGARAVVHIPLEKRGKLDDRGRICQLVGFQDDSRGIQFQTERPTSKNENTKLS
ncbi:hypothetical protein O181_077110 [Austropuccinia psidii MF-1]|uniref:Integrase catalytic domain-containing protein n=1 Tax=Austropuccinia psidii MF-1 TaxID=1389203 RepID=A0A9Q3FHE9_9BASI|nr:hypothetical protein [Austropuccinia psidii MF-1]